MVNLLLKRLSSSKIKKSLVRILARRKISEFYAVLFSFISKMKILQLCFLCFCLSWLASRTQSLPDNRLQLPEGQTILFLDSVAASQAIIQDRQEFFFEQIGRLDMSIQLKQHYPENITRDSILSIYKQSLQAATLDFTPDEIAFISQAMRKAYRLCQQLQPDIFPPRIRMIKGYGYHYGYAVYYTREDCIFIPQNELLKRDEAAFLQVMLHEIFHIYSRYHPEKKKALYERIGFKSIGAVTHLQMAPELRQRILLNPDGINYAYAIRIKNEQQSMQAIPLIVSKYAQYDPGKMDFFSYLDFRLYPIRPPFSRLIQVQSLAKGASPLSQSSISGFYEQIGDNTDYIIHPDEILADNFVLIATNKMDHSSYSEYGFQLLQDLKSILID